MPDTAPRFSVVIPVFDSEATLGRTLESLIAFFDARQEVIVVDDGSNDASAAVAERFPCRVIRLAGNSGPAVARNRGADEAGGEIIVFIDADVEALPGLLDALERHFRDPGIHAVQGIYEESRTTDDLVTSYQNDYYHHVFRRSISDRTGICATYCFAVRKRVFSELGGFEERIGEPTVEDEEFGYRMLEAGYPIRLTDQIQVRHLATYDLRQFVKRRLRMSRNQIRSLLRRKASIPIDDVVRKGDNPSHHPFSMVAGIPLSLAGWISLFIAIPLTSAPLAITGLGLWSGALLLNLPLILFLGRRGFLRFVVSAGCLILDWTTLNLGFLLGTLDFLRGRKY